MTKDFPPAQTKKCGDHLGIMSFLELIRNPY
jgi:hypothetical protein